jgi:hypothetical protein
MSDLIVQDFKNNLISFLDELIEQFPHESDFIIARIFLKDRIDPELVMNTFIKELLPHAAAIEKRDDSLFLENKLELFASINPSQVNHFKLLWKSDALDVEDRQIMWKWFDTFVYLALQYQKAKLNETKM